MPHKQMYAGNQTYLQPAFKDTTSVPRGYFTYWPQTNGNYSLRSNIFPGERQVVYVKHVKKTK